MDSILGDFLKASQHVKSKSVEQKEHFDLYLNRIKELVIGAEGVVTQD